MRRWMPATRYSPPCRCPFYSTMHMQTRISTVKQERCDDNNPNSALVEVQERLSKMRFNHFPIQVSDVDGDEYETGAVLTQKSERVNFNLREEDVNYDEDMMPTYKNSGKKSTYAAETYCGVCDTNEDEDGTKWIQCDDCTYWFHARYTTSRAKITHHKHLSCTAASDLGGGCPIVISIGIVVALGKRRREEGGSLSSSRITSATWRI